VPPTDSEFRVEAVAKALHRWRTEIAWSELPAEIQEECVAEALWALIAADHADEEAGIARVFKNAERRD
jgi:hypothetical protein